MKYSSIIIAGLFWGVFLPKAAAQQDKTELPAFFLTHEQVEGQRMAYYHLDQQDKEIAGLTVFEYEDDRLLSLPDSINLDHQLSSASTFVVKLPVQSATVHKLRVRYKDNEVFFTGYASVDNKEFRPGSEFNTDNYSLSTSYGSPQIDKSFEQGELQLNGIRAGRGFGIHASGSAEMRFTAGLYDRFTGYAGKQSGKNGNISFSLKVNETITYPAQTFSPGNHYTFDQELDSEATSVRIDIGTGNDGNGGDHGSICSPYFFMKESRQAQQIEEEGRSEKIQVFTDTMTLAPAVSTTAGLDCSYTIVRGTEYAEVRGGHIFVREVNALDTLIIQAFHPGNTEYQATNPILLKYVFSSSLDVPKDETMTLLGGGRYEKIMLHSDGLQTGQINIPQGVVTVDVLEIHMHLNAEQWYHFSLPFDLDLNKESNLSDLGFSLTGESGKARFEIKEFSKSEKASDPTSNGWVESTTTTFKANKAYLFRLANTAQDEPQDLIFTLDNNMMRVLDGSRKVNLSVDLGYAPTNSKQVVYVKPSNVEGDVLRVEIDFQPSSSVELPMNYEQELKHARVTFTPNREGIRITLPTQEVAKVAIFKSDDFSFVKAFNYISPNLIDITDLTPGSYELVVKYGEAENIFSFKK